jgi:hypothetical protein
VSQAGADRIKSLGDRRTLGQATTVIDCQDCQPKGAAVFINITYDQSDDLLPSGFKSTIDQVVQLFDATFTSPVTINIAVSLNEVHGQPISSPAIAQSFFQFASVVSYAQLRAALITQNAAGSETLPLTDPTGRALRLGRAEEKALGFLTDSSNTVDGWVGFSSAAAANANFFGIVAHEITETMGRSSLLDHTGLYGSLDLFRYSAPGVWQLVAGQPAYFSIDGGATNLDDFNTVAGRDYGDWASSVGPDAFSANMAGPVTQTDLLVVQSLGWNAFVGKGHIATGSLGDFTGEGRSDVLWWQSSGAIAEWQTNLAGQLASAQALGTTSSAWKIEGVGYFDANGRSDVLFRNVDGSIAAWETDPTGQLTSAKLLGTTAPIWRVDGIGDFDGNGRSDILFRDSAGSIALWQTDQEGQLASAKLIGSAASAWHIAGIGDFDGNGRSDLLFRNVDGSLAVWQTDAAGQLSSAQQIGTVASSWHVVDIGDFDGNGRSDILFVNDNGSVALWQTNAAGQLASASSLTSPGIQWHEAGTGDFNGDGRSDILWDNDAGTVLEWLMNGTQIQSTQTLGSAPTNWEISVHHFDLV